MEIEFVWSMTKIGGGEECVTVKRRIFSLLRLAAAGVSTGVRRWSCGSNDATELPGLGYYTPFLPIKAIGDMDEENSLFRGKMINLRIRFFNDLALSQSSREYIYKTSIRIQPIRYPSNKYPYKPNQFNAQIMVFPRNKDRTKKEKLV
jgi:hypothetical protein